MNVLKLRDSIATIIFLFFALRCFGQLNCPAAAIGKYPVGVRYEIFQRVVNSGNARELNTSIFYPAKATKIVENHVYLADSVLLAALVDEKYLGFPVESIREWTRLKTASVNNAEPRARKFPLVFVLHGRGSSRISYTILAETIASHGFIVVVADHPGSGLTVSSNGAKVGLLNPANLLQEVMDMSEDVSFIKDQILSLRFYKTLIDKDNVALIGHSLGSMTAFELADSAVSSFKTVINYDGYPSKKVLDKGTKFPHLTIWGELPTHLTVPVDTLKVRREIIWRKFFNASREKFYVVNEKGMYHNDFNDQIFFRIDRRSARYPGAIESCKGFLLNARITIAYLNYQLKNAPKEKFLASLNPSLVSVIYPSMN